MLRTASTLLQRAVGTSRHLALASTSASEQLQALRSYAAEAAPQESAASQPQILKFGVQGLGKETITTVTTLNNAHTIRVDEPKFLGGKDTAANPVEYLLASLVGCIQVTLHVIAAEQRIDLKRVTWDADGDLDLRGFLGVQGVFPGFQRIDVTARISTDVSAAVLEALRHKVIERCPVGNTIKAPGVVYNLRFIKV